MSERSGGIGILGALSIGVGGIVGGGFFATFGLTAAGAAGGTPIAFLIGGLIALLTAYSYTGLSIRYPGPGGTASFIATAFGTSLPAAAVNVLLILSYIAIMSVYASALGNYCLPYMPDTMKPYASHLVSSLALIGLGLINFIGAGLVQKSETLFNIGKLTVLILFIIAGLMLPGLEWQRLEPAAWAAPSAIVASGMIGFLAYEGFELIANSSGDVANPKRTLPIAFMGSVVIAIVIYVLAFIVGIGHLSMEQLIAAKDFAISAAAESFLGSFGFALMAVGAVLASASAINADYFGAAKLPPQLAAMNELSSAFQRSLRGRSVASLVAIGVLSLLALNFISIEALSSATSGGFLLVFAAVNIAAYRLAPETGANRFIPVVAALLCLLALGVTLWQFLSDPATAGQAAAIGALVVLAFALEILFRIRHALYMRYRKAHPR